MKPVRLSVPLRPALTEAARVLALELLVSPKYGPRQSSFMRRRVLSRHACLLLLSRSQCLNLALDLLRMQVKRVKTLSVTSHDRKDDQVDELFAIDLGLL
jgi:hypothetical protein